MNHKSTRLFLALPLLMLGSLASCSTAVDYSSNPIIGKDGKAFLLEIGTIGDSRYVLDAYSFGADGTGFHYTIVMEKTDTALTVRTNFNYTLVCVDDSEKASAYEITMKMENGETNYGSIYQRGWTCYFFNRENLRFYY